MSNPVHRIAFLLATAAALPGQCPPGAELPMPREAWTTLPKDSAARTRLTAANQALAAGDAASARQHLAAALEFHPGAAELWLEMLLASRDDADLVLRNADRLVACGTNDKGRFDLPAPAKKRLSGAAFANNAIKEATALTQTRLAALAELLRFAQKQKARPRDNATRALLLRWVSELLLRVGERCPVALGAMAEPVDALQRAFAPDHELVYKALAAVMQRRASSGDGADAAASARIEDQRVRAARILVGLERQAGFDKLQGPPPVPPGRIAEEARELLEDERRQDVESGRIWTIAELEAMTPEQVVQFTLDHRDWRNPGIAMSTTGRYRIETACGHDTLLGTARTVELHHARLVDHYGKDPFVERLGVVRIVPEAADLETEGVPHWWAGGFQAGDRTTVRFAWGRIPGLGRTLTHELTHRFDGTLRAFLPSWYVEGHAEWTAKHYGKMAEPRFLANYLDIGTPSHTWYKGYGNREKFEKLLRGDVEEYRDNYPAGYSLYAMLASYPPGAPRYRPVLAKFEQNGRAGRKDPLAWFTSVFCDGKEGRPADLDGLFADWVEFTRGCYEWLDDKKKEHPWIGRYDFQRDGESAPQVPDVPTRSWARKRAEPFFGQDHAAAATLLLTEVADHEGAAAAGVWSLTVDGWRPEVTRALDAALRALGPAAAEASEAFAALASARYTAIPSGEARRLTPALPKTVALLEALQERAAAIRATAPTAAGDLLTEASAIATLLGRNVEAPTSRSSAEARQLVAHGFAESSLVDFEERRHPGLWFLTPEGDVHVGREKPREATGTLDRQAHQRHAFAHCTDWIAPGSYVLRGRVHFTTSFVAGAIVFGMSRRDRCLRLHFSSGDFDYATGRSEDNARSGRVRLGLQGLWERDGEMPGTEQQRGEVDLPAEQSWFEYAVHVDGPRVAVAINGEMLLSYAVHDGTPIEGMVGFAMSTGAVRVQQPTVQRLAADSVGLDVTAAASGNDAATLADWLMLPTRGIPTGPQGTLVLWLPPIEDGSPIDNLGRALREISRIARDQFEHPQGWLLAVPKDTTADDRKAAREELEAMCGTSIAVIEHRLTAPFDGRYPWVLFVDGQGVLRAAARAGDTALHTRVDRWARLYRERH